MKLYHTFQYIIEWMKCHPNSKNILLYCVYIVLFKYIYIYTYVICINYIMYKHVYSNRVYHVHCIDYIYIYIMHIVLTIEVQSGL